MKINLEDRNVFEAQMTIDEARALLDYDIPENVTNALDQAQGFVFCSDGDHSYLVIKIG